MIAAPLLAFVLGVMQTVPTAHPPERFTVTADDGHPLTVWTRQPVVTHAAVLLIHGRTWSSRPDFDLQVPGMERSVMRSLAARGIAAYAVDLRGYGATPRDRTGWMTPHRAAGDVQRVLSWIGERHPGLARPVLVGWSRGAAIAMLAAQAAPASVSGLVLFGFAFDPGVKFGDPVGLPPRPLAARNTAEAAVSDFISPRVTSPVMVRAFVDQALAADPVMVDVRFDQEFNTLEPRRVTMPMMVVFGDRDPAFVRADADRLLGKVATTDKRLVVLSGGDHAAQIEDTHEQWVGTVVAFTLRVASGGAK